MLWTSCEVSKSILSSHSAVTACKLGSEGITKHHAPLKDVVHFSQPWLHIRLGHEVEDLIHIAEAFGEEMWNCLPRIDILHDVLGHLHIRQEQGQTCFPEVPAWNGSVGEIALLVVTDLRLELREASLGWLPRGTNF
eukprot:CAMPEP_0178413078 /NCGR_PEP_ID=MMETSP0689_2-20121128/22344_1 /TAXON_ID=160604 /ORGANISM="Amphidinium massartii, Strain CS-259" /LENGTH=136 /DNA_ID=CAMNT_0020034343 /DNA_START=52 /DNA_END=462 /DNA_ORIENTATION=-